jgi:biotin synthase
MSTQKSNPASHLPGDAGISADEATGLLGATSGAAFDELLARANQARELAFGATVGLCAIVNARAGGCSEDCAYCAQSRRAAGPSSVQHDLLSPGELGAAARGAAAAGASSFSVVTAGRRLAGGKNLEVVEEALRATAAASGMRRCASLGLMDEASLRRLRQAGLQRYHHNLETARSFFPRICTTHSFDDKLATIHAARAAGLQICSGGIFGLGESPAQRIELAEALRALNPDGIPINFLDARPGTPLAAMPHIRPEECLATIAVFRLMFPRAEIIVMGGREAQLGSMQDLIFRAGASATIVGDYLTHAGSSAREVMDMLRAQGLRPQLAGPAGAEARPQAAPSSDAPSAAPVARFAGAATGSEPGLSAAPSAARVARQKDRPPSS